MPHMSLSSSMTLRTLTTVGLVLALALGGCSRCGKTAAPTTGIDRHLPRSAEAVVVVPDVAVLGEKLKILQRLQIATFLAQLQGFGSAEQFVSSIMSQVGIDLRKREEMEKIGLAPDKGLAVVIRPDDTAYAVIAVKDPSTFEKAIAHVAKARLGAGTTRKEGEATIFAKNETSPAVLAMVVKSGYAFLSQGPDVQALLQASNVTEADSLAKTEALSAGLKRLPSERDVYAFIPAAKPAGGKKDAKPTPVTLTASLTEKGLTLRSDAPMKDRPEVLAAFKSQEAVKLLGYVPADAFLMARFAGDPAALDAVWPHLVGDNVARAVKKSGFDVKGQILDNLQPGIALGVSLAPNVPIAAGLPRLDVRRTNPFRYVHLSAIAEVKDPAKARAMMDGLPQVAQGFGATLTPATRVEQPVLLTTWSQGEGAHLGLSGKRLVVGAPEERLVGLLERVKAGPAKTPVRPELAGVFDTNTFAAVVDLEKLARAIEALPTEAWGIGGFVIRDTALRWLAAVDDLKAIVVASSAKDDAVQSEFTLRIAPKPEAAPK